MVTPSFSGELIGAQLGPYRIEWLIGEGGMARVYRATDGNGGALAIKVVRRAWRAIACCASASSGRRTASRLQSPYLVPVLEIGEYQGSPFLVQPYMSGGSLEDLLADRGRLGIAEALDIAAQVAEGLAVLAAEDLVHRDVKPPNVLLDAAGRALVADFGLVRDSRGTVLTRIGQALGSPHYMAPEQVRGDEVTSATDVYSLGCLLYECLTGATPFAQERGMQVLWAQLNRSPANPCEELPGAPEALGDAVLQALIKDPAKRPRSAPEYVRSVCRAAGVEPTAPGRVTHGESSR